MNSHPFARMTLVSRERLIRRHLDEGVPLPPPPGKLTPVHPDLFITRGLDGVVYASLQ